MCSNLTSCPSLSALRYGEEFVTDFREMVGERKEQKIEKGEGKERNHKIVWGWVQWDVTWGPVKETIIIGWLTRTEDSRDVQWGLLGCLMYSEWWDSHPVTPPTFWLNLVSGSYVFLQFSTICFPLAPWPACIASDLFQVSGTFWRCKIRLVDQTGWSRSPHEVNFAAHTSWLDAPVLKTRTYFILKSNSSSSPQGPQDFGISSLVFYQLISS